MKAVLIEADTISSAWSRLIYEIYKNGEDHKPDYSTGTRRLHATVVINDVNADQVNSFVPFGENLIKKYKEELTEEYADWYVSLPDDDRRKFDYCYAKQLFRYGETAYNTLSENVKNLRVGSRRHVGVRRFSWWWGGAPRLLVPCRAESRRVDVVSDNARFSSPTVLGCAWR